MIATSYNGGSGRNTPCYRCIVIALGHEIRNPDFVRYIREFWAELRVSPSRALDTVHDYHRDAKVMICDIHRKIVELDLSVIDIDVDELTEAEALIREEMFRDWFAYMAQPIPDGHRPYITERTLERFRVFSTVLMARFPDEPWPRQIPANMNEFSANDESVFRH